MMIIISTWRLERKGYATGHPLPMSDGEQCQITPVVKKGAPSAPYRFDRESGRAASEPSGKIPPDAASLHTEPRQPFPRFRQVRQQLPIWSVPSRHHEAIALGRLPCVPEPLGDPAELERGEYEKWSDAPSSEIVNLCGWPAADAPRR
jgi:hypothetical protein